ncbi:MAG: endonuclease/exonuclease/phosphatase family protein, partial [Thermoleophilia bacterium]|nr:endonuclease/exonuclease/phosphatase family protein [Thermoleophilia bacterium]
MWWNLNGPNANRLRAQVQRLCALRPLPELLGLCEVPTERVGDLRDLVQPVGYEVFPAASDLEPKIKQVVIASRLPARPISTARFKVRADHPVREARGFDVWPKAVSSIDVSAGEQALSVHAVHIPNGSRNGWVKFDHLWALRDGLEHKQGPAIVCGDFNAPRLEVGSR